MERFIGLEIIGGTVLEFSRLKRICRICGDADSIGDSDNGGGAGDADSSDGFSREIVIAREAISAMASAGRVWGRPVFF